MRYRQCMKGERERQGGGEKGREGNGKINGVKYREREEREEITQIKDEIVEKMREKDRRRALVGERYKKTKGQRKREGKSYI